MALHSGLLQFSLISSPVGLIIEPGKKYSQTVENSFHISKATLDLSAINGKLQASNLWVDYI